MGWLGGARISKALSLVCKLSCAGRKDGRRARRLKLCPGRREPDEAAAGPDERIGDDSMYGAV